MEVLSLALGFKVPSPYLVFHCEKYTLGYKTKTFLLLVWIEDQDRSVNGRLSGLLTLKLVL